MQQEAAQQRETPSESESTILTMLLGILSSLLVVLIHGVLTTAMLQKRPH